MSAFYVGQRVRVVRAYYPENEGVECIVVGINRVGVWPRTGEKYSGYLLDVKNRNGGQCVAKEYQLEPILRPDNEVGDWAELGFHPSEFVRETAPCKP